MSEASERPLADARVSRAEALTQRFLEELDYVVGGDVRGLTAMTPLAEILHPRVLAPHELLLMLSGVLECEIDEIDQARIRPEADTIGRMMARFAA